jgi:uncharacterized membrane protein
MTKRVHVDKLEKAKRVQKRNEIIAAVLGYIVLAAVAIFLLWIIWQGFIYAPMVMGWSLGVVGAIVLFWWWMTSWSKADEIVNQAERYGTIDE